MGKTQKCDNALNTREAIVCYCHKSDNDLAASL